jgi:hypothetical protein
MCSSFLVKLRVHQGPRFLQGNKVTGTSVPVDIQRASLLPQQLDDRTVETNMEAHGHPSRSGTWALLACDNSIYFRAIVYGMATVY